MRGVPIRSIREVRRHLADVVDRADRHESTIITRHGNEVAAVVPIEVLRRFDYYEDQAIVRMAEDRMKNPAPGIPMGEVMAEFRP